MSVIDHESNVDSAMQRVLDRLDRAAQEQFLAELSTAIDKGGQEPARILHEWTVSMAFRGTIPADEPRDSVADLDDIAGSHGIDMVELRRSWAATRSTTGTT